MDYFKKLQFPSSRIHKTNLPYESYDVYVVCVLMQINIQMQTTFFIIEIVILEDCAALLEVFLYLFMAPSASSSLRMSSGACPPCGVKAGV